MLKIEFGPTEGGSLPSGTHRMITPIRVLIIEDSPDDAEILVRELILGGFDPEYERVESADAMSAALAIKPWDIVIADCALPQFSAIAALELLRLKGMV